jgi:hypothetical protein
MRKPVKKKTISTNTSPITEVRFVDIKVAPWDGVSGRTYSLIGLSDEGKVYRFEMGAGRWVGYNMESLEVTR